MIIVYILVAYICDILISHWMAVPILYATQCMLFYSFAKGYLHAGTLLALYLLHVPVFATSWLIALVYIATIIMLIYLYRWYVHPTWLRDSVITWAAVFGSVVHVIGTGGYIASSLWTQMVIFVMIIVAEGLRHVCRKVGKATA